MLLFMAILLMLLFIEFIEFMLLFVGRMAAMPMPLAPIVLFMLPTAPKADGCWPKLDVLPKDDVEALRCGLPGGGGRLKPEGVPVLLPGGGAREKDEAED